MFDHQTRREFLQKTAASAAGCAGLSSFRIAATAADKKKPALLYKISCTEYSLHRMIGKKELDNLDYAPFVKKTFSIDAVEYWNVPFIGQAKNTQYIAQMKKNAENAGVKATCILIDREGNLGDPDTKRRMAAVENHKKWVEAAKALGAPSIRVNARSKGTYNEQLKLAADGLRRLATFAKPLQMDIIVENHGGLSSNGQWLSTVMKQVGMKNCGTLPDFGNFGKYDRYKGVKELMPYAKLISAKTHDFDKNGNEVHTDYRRMMKIVVDAGYHDYVGIEYEGSRLTEIAGVKATKRLLERTRDALARNV